MATIYYLLGWCKLKLFNVNGRETDDLNEALAFVDQVWHESKVDAVLEQRKAALAKPTEIDRQRAELGVEPNLASR